jgi:hypothetical protein
MRHPFYREVYAKLLAKVQKRGTEGSAEGTQSTARLAEDGLYLLVLASTPAGGECASTRRNNSATSIPTGACS